MRFGLRALRASLGLRTLRTYAPRRFSATAGGICRRLHIPSPHLLPPFNHHVSTTDCAMPLTQTFIQQLIAFAYVSMPIIGPSYIVCSPLCTHNYCFSLCISSFMPLHYSVCCDTFIVVIQRLWKEKPSIRQAGVYCCSLLLLCCNTVTATCAW